MGLIALGRQPLCVTEIRVGKEAMVSGRLDVNSVAELRLGLTEILDRGAGDLLVHLAQAEVHDAAGLGVIVGLHHRARRVGRRFVLVDVSPRLDRLLRASHLDRVLARGSGGAEVTVVASPRPVVQSETPVVQSETVAPFTE